MSSCTWIDGETRGRTGVIRNWSARSPRSPTFGGPDLATLLVKNWSTRAAQIAILNVFGIGNLARMAMNRIAVRIREWLVEGRRSCMVRGKAHALRLGRSS